jgi:hypothetical protein
MAHPRPVSPPKILEVILVSASLNQRHSGQTVTSAPLLVSHSIHALIAPYRLHSIYVTGTILLNLLEQALAEATEKELANICYVFLSD